MSNNNSSLSLLWRHNGRHSVSNHQPHDCLLNPSFRHRSKKHLPRCLKSERWKRRFEQWSDVLNLFHSLDGASAMHSVKEICEGLFRYHPLYFQCSVKGQKQMVVSPWCQLLMLQTWQNHAQDMMQLHCNNKTAVKPPYNLVSFELSLSFTQNHHGVGTPGVVDPQRIMLYWRSRYIFYIVCWGAGGCEWGTTSVYFGNSCVCFIPRMIPAFIVRPQHRHRFFYSCQKYIVKVNLI